MIKQEQNDFNITERIGIVTLLVIIYYLFFRKKRQTAPLETATSNSNLLGLTAALKLLPKRSDVNSEHYATQGQTEFTLPNNLPTGAIVKAYLGGVLLPFESYTVLGSTITYLPEFNDNTILEAGNRINFIY